MNQAWIAILPAFLRDKLEGRHDFQKIIANTGWLFIDKIVRMGGGLLVGVWLARYLGPERFGQFNYAAAFVAIFSAIASLGLDGIVVRDIIKEPARTNEILGTAFMLRLIGGLIAFTMIMISIFVLRPFDTLTQLLVGIIALGMFFQSVDIIDLWFQSQVLSRYTVIAKITSFMLLAVVKVSLILCEAPLAAFAWVASAEVAVGAGGLVIAYTVNSGRILNWKNCPELGRRLLHDSWPLIFSSIVIMVYMRIDQLMLGEIVGSGEVGIYSVAVSLAEVWYFIPGAIVSSTFPSIITARVESEDLFYERLQRLYNTMALTAYGIALPVTFLAEPVITLLYGTAYSKAGPMLSVLIWAGIFTNLGIARSSFLTTMNWTRVHFMTVFFGCVINIVLNLILIPRYGGMGAVIASCVAYWFAAHGACYLYPPLFRTGNMLTRALLYPKVW
jgi:O-antigen/teichoic acid export membrane protein